MKLELSNLIKYADQQISSRTLTKKIGSQNAVTLLCFASGESVSNESSTGVKLIHVIDGELLIKTTEDITLKKNDMLSLEPNELHSIEAKENCSFLQIELSPGK